ncbi:DUF4386 domain-containing protein [Fusibacter bizertensis]|uniref:DUF4386 domain-containing protein n=1 Tax=Fusibacter bizertensis TaxID=1488331 RepID=A0ABT6NF23_9FIRM|nr:DUF4386 domain-containing protein [Fusibacter bizertensis]MDH8679028.1 DUF4386 domain-containing protein [Fusibacter bizertensis]
METVNFDSDQTIKKAARIGGISYVLLILLGLFAELFVRSSLITGTMTETVSNITSNELLFRLGFFSDLLMVLLDITVGIALYVIFRNLNKTLAMTGLILRMIQSVLLAMNLQRMHTALLYFKNDIIEPVFSQILGIYQLEMFRYGYFLALVFFGLYLIVIALQFRQTDYFNKIVVFFIGVSGTLYVADSIVNFIFPQFKMYTGSNVSMLIWIVTEFAIAIGLIRLSFRKKSFYKR